MAFYQNEDEDKKELSPNQTQTVGPESGTISQGASTSSAPGQGAAPTSTPTTAGTSPAKNPGNFVGIRQYLDANKNQSARLGGQVAGVLTDTANTARNTAKEQGDLFNQDVDRNTIGVNQGVFDLAKQNAAKVSGDTGARNEFIKMRDATYKGPGSFEESNYFEPTNQAFTKAQKLGENSKTAEGQKSLINQVQQNSTGRIGSQGVTAFDQMLLGGSPEARAQLESAREAQSDLPGVFDRLKAFSANKAAQARATTDATRNAVQQAFGSQGDYGQGALERALNQRVASQRAVASSNAERLKNALKQGGQGLSDADLGLLGLSRGDYDQLTGGTSQINDIRNRSGVMGLTGSDAPDFSQFLNVYDPNSRITAQNVANADEYARYAALNDLMGTTGGLLSDPTQAGQYSTDTIDLNTQAAKNYLENLIEAEKSNSIKNFNFSVPQMGSVPISPYSMVSDRSKKKNVKRFNSDEFLSKLNPKKIAG